jgi:hypothetical protein
MMPNRPRIGRRAVLTGIAAAGAVALCGASRAAGPPGPAQARKGDPEPLQHFPGLSEGFYRLGDTVLYVDGQHRAFAPRDLDPHRLLRLPLAHSDLGELVRKLRRRRFVFTVEHAVLERLHTDRPLALALLAEALASGPAPGSIRLRHLRAAIEGGREGWRAAGTDGRAVLIRLNRPQEQFGPVF